MANPHRGDIAFDADGKTWTLRYSTNALCELEDDLGEGVAALGKSMANPAGVKLKTLRSLVWAGLRDHHADLDKRQAGDLIDAAGAQRIGELVMEAFKAAFPVADKPAKSSETRPTLAQVKAG